MRIVIPHKPTAKGRPRRSRSGHMYTPKITRDFEAFVESCVREVADGYVFDGPLEVWICHYFPVPKSTAKRDLPYMEGAPRAKRPDLENLNKALIDGCQNAGVFHDDSQICRINAEKLYTLSDTKSVILIDYFQV